MEVYPVTQLPQAGHAAAAAFFAEHYPAIADVLAREPCALAIVLPPAPSAHDDWRRALSRDLARAHAPLRVNVIGGGSEGARSATLAYLSDAPGVTGQYLALDEPSG